MTYTSLTPEQSASIRASYAAMLAMSRARRAHHRAECELRAALRNHHWSNSAIGELIEADRALRSRGF